MSGVLLRLAHGADDEADGGARDALQHRYEEHPYQRPLVRHLKRRTCRSAGRGPAAQCVSTVSAADLEDEDGEGDRHDDLQQIDHERHEEVGERKLARRHSRDPRPVEEALVALHDDDHGAVAEGHAVHDRQDDARRHEVREGEVFGPVDRLLEHQGDAGDLLRDAARGNLRNTSPWPSCIHIANSPRNRTNCSKKCWKASTSLICSVYAMC